MLPRTAPDASRAAPDYLGALLICLSLGALVLGLTQGPTWGWSTAGRGRVLRRGDRARRRVRGSVRAPPRAGARPHLVSDAELLRRERRDGALRDGVLRDAARQHLVPRPSVWHYSILTAGLAVTPGPLVVAITAGPAGELASRIGFRPVLLVGAALLATGLAMFALRVGVQPDYSRCWLPATLLIGLGIGLTFPVLGAAAVVESAARAVLGRQRGEPDRTPGRRRRSASRSSSSSWAPRPASRRSTTSSTCGGSQRR